MNQPSTLVAITGGSGSGKSWLAQQLQRELPDRSVHFSQDDFYRDCSDVPADSRDDLNFDHPRALDWESFRETLTACRAGKAIRVPDYDFATHSRLQRARIESPAPIVLVDGLWLLLVPAVRQHFDLAIFLDAPAAVRLERRIRRDTVERGRTASSVRAQFWRTVNPMHERHVQPQVRHADLVLRQPAGPSDLDDIVDRIHALRTRSRIPCNEIPFPGQYTPIEVPVTVNSMLHEIHF